MESDPAQINTDKISTEGYKNFEIIVKKSKYTTKNKILNNKDLSVDDQDFNLYYYGVDAVNVKVDNKEMILEEVLKSEKFTLHGIVGKANTDFPNANGGSIDIILANKKVFRDIGLLLLFAYSIFRIKSEVYNDYD